MEEEDGEDMKEEEAVAEVMTEVVVVEVDTMVEEGEDLVVMEVEEVDMKVDEEVKAEEDLDEEAIREEEAEVGRVQGASKGTRGTFRLTRVKPRGGEGVVTDLCITSLS